MDTKPERRAFHNGYKPNRKPPRHDPGEGRDPKTMIGTESHMDLFRHLIKAGDQGIHNPPGPPKPKRG